MLELKRARARARVLENKISCCDKTQSVVVSSLISDQAYLRSKSLRGGNPVRFIATALYFHSGALSVFLIKTADR